MKMQLMVKDKNETTWSRLSTSDDVSPERKDRAITQMVRQRDEWVRTVPDRFLNSSFQIVPEDRSTSHFAINHH